MWVPSGGCPPHEGCCVLMRCGALYAMFLSLVCNCECFNLVVDRYGNVVAIYVYIYNLVVELGHAWVVCHARHSGDCLQALCAGPDAHTHDHQAVCTGVGAGEQILDNDNVMFLLMSFSDIIFCDNNMM
jgi:hypothetical protein